MGEPLGMEHLTHLVFRAGVFGLRPQFGLPASPRGSWCCGAGGVFGLRPQTPIKLGVSKSLANVNNIQGIAKEFIVIGSLEFLSMFLAYVVRLL